MARAFVLIAMAAHTAAAMNELEIDAAQKVWADGILNIASKHKQGESHDYIKALADQFVDSVYAHTMGPSSVLVKPATQLPDDSGPAAGFCLSRECIIFSLIGQSTNPQEVGLALRPWSSIRFENVGFVLQNDSAMAMGTSFFLDSFGAELKIEYSIGYVRDSAGKIRINMFHSSLAAANHVGELLQKQSDVSNQTEEAHLENAVNASRETIEEQLDKVNANLAELESNGTQSTAADTAAPPLNDIGSEGVANVDGQMAAGEEVAVAKSVPEEADGLSATSTASTSETTTAATTTTTTATTTTTTTATTTAVVTTTKDWFYDRRGVDRNHVLHSVGRPTKAPTEATSGINIAAIMFALIPISIIVAFGITITVQMQSRPELSASKNIIASASLLQRRMQSMTSERTSTLQTDFDKSV